MKIVFHGAATTPFRTDFEKYLDDSHDISLLTEQLKEPGELEQFVSADIIIGTALKADHPVPKTARLYHVAGAGYDGIEVKRLPPGCRLCNCFGHEDAIAEYVMAALLARNVPLADADSRLRQGDWTYMAGRPGDLRQECSGGTIGLLGYGHIGRAVARCAKAFNMVVHVANRSLVSQDANVDHYWPLSQITAFYKAVDVVIVALPLNDATVGLVDRKAFAAMRPESLIINVGRGPVIDELALYDALKSGEIGSAIIDTWYVYPDAETASPYPGNLPFHNLKNITITPHMSGWTWGTIRRRQQTISENIQRLAAGKPLINVVFGDSHQTPGSR